MKKSFKFLIAVGILNVLHGGIHIAQFLQSMLMSYYSFSFSGKQPEWIEAVMESPWMGLVWGLLGILTLWIVYKDHKKKHETEN